MCVQLLTTALSAGANIYGATQSPTGNAAQDTATAGNIQALASGADALGDLAMGSARARMARSQAAGERAMGEQRASRIRRQGAMQIAEGRSQVVGSGVKLTSSSALEAERSLVQAIEQDAGVAILTGQGRANSLQAAGDQYQLAGLNSAISGGADAFGKWRRSRPMPQTRSVQYNPVGDGFVTDPQAGP